MDGGSISAQKSLIFVQIMKNGKWKEQNFQLRGNPSCQA
jgi:hypothetical protein